MAMTIDTKSVAEILDKRAINMIFPSLPPVSGDR
jgi:hypothetical protein